MLRRGGVHLPGKCLLMLCEFQPTIRPYLQWCPTCGLPANADKRAVGVDGRPTNIIYRECIGRTVSWRPKPGGYGLGDYVAWLLKRLWFGKLKTCRCNERQATLNRLWNWSTFRRRITSPREAWRDARATARATWLALAARMPSRRP